MHIVIDGYNLIRQSPWLKSYENTELQRGRQALVDALAVYKRAKGHVITIVFDGAQAATGMPRRDRIKGIDLCYSRSGESADTVIKRMAARDREKILVVSSDNEIVRFVEACGAAAIGAPQFAELLWMAQSSTDGAESATDAESTRRRNTHKKGPARRPPKRKRQVTRRIAKL